MAESYTHRCAVLISAYGRSPYLAEQLRSVAEQVGPEDVVIVVDDGSRAVAWPELPPLPAERVYWTRVDRLGHAASFLDVFLNCDVRAECYFFADQDDIWLPGKLETQLATLRAGQAVASVHGWREFDSHGGRILAERQPVPRHSLAHYFFETPAPGMTLCIAGRVRSQLARLIPEPVRRHPELPHDRLLCALLALLGDIAIEPEILVNYRQHGANAIGAVAASSLVRVRRQVGAAPRIFRTHAAAVRLYREAIAALGLPAPPLHRQCLRHRPADNRLLHLILATHHLLGPGRPAPAITGSSSNPRSIAGTGHSRG